MLIRVYSIADGTLSIEEFRDLSEVTEQTLDRGCWIDIAGFGETDLSNAGERLQLDPLTIEDISTGKQRIKVEEYPGYVYAVCKGVSVTDDQKFNYSVDEISLILKQSLVVTFQSGKSEIISRVVKAIKNRVSTIKDSSILSTMAMHLIYDYSVDSFYDALSNVESWLISTGDEAIDVNSMKASDLQGLNGIMAIITKAKREMSELRTMLTQHRDVMSLAERGSIRYVSVDMMTQFRDVYDHTFQLIETLDSYMLRTSDIRDLYFTLRAAFTDNVLRLLTIVATIFLPLSFLTGFYGMNFTTGFDQPGSSSSYGFYALTAGMIALSVILFITFRKKGWT
ncbi:MAG: magnesium transporter CorA family protein [Thermoplasmataceae archaeon]